jgi:hypothetical protein
MIAPADVDAIAAAVCERLGGDLPQLLTANQVAERLAVEPAWVYSHADELGAIRLGSGDKPRLRFDQAEVAAYLTAGYGRQGSQHGDSAPGAALQRRRRRSQPASAKPVPDTARGGTR